MITANQLDRINYYNVLAMFVSAGLAMLIPFELVLLSYAILGPAHYLTEISWLNGRQFFTLKKYDYWIIIAAIVLGFVFKLHYANLVFYTFGLSFILLAFKNNLVRAITFVVLIASGYFLLSHNLLRTIFGLYVPTLIHVYLFTGVFLLLGALKGKSASGYISLLAFIVFPVLLCVLFTGWHNQITAWASKNYITFAQLNRTTLRSHSINIYTNTASIILTRVIAFAYTYHYLNWFSKTRIINWHRVSIKRAVVIGVIWAASVGLYFYNYRIGFYWLFLLSLVHVILEFPLNHRSFMGVGRELKSRWSPTAGK